MTPAEEDRELWRNFMESSVEKLRFDMAASQKQLTWETWKFAVSLLVALAVVAGASAAIATYFARPAGPVYYIIQAQPLTEMPAPRP
jgi:hypothetical protein